MINSVDQAFLFKKDEYIKLLLKSLTDMGFDEAKGALEKESGVCLDEPYLDPLRGAVIEGDWTKAVDLLATAKFSCSLSRMRAKYEIIRNKYIEELINNNIPNSLKILREEILPLHIEMEEVASIQRTANGALVSMKDLEILASLFICSDAKSIRTMAGWSKNLPVKDEREVLWNRVSGYMAPDTRIPQHRLENLVCQALRHQENECIYHNTVNKKFSLCEDHQCSKLQLPGKIKYELNGHNRKEVWTIAFSYNGKSLASSGTDGFVCLWDMSDGTILSKYNLEPKNSESTSAALVLRWSFDDKSLLVGCPDGTVRHWQNFRSNNVSTYTHHDKEVTGISWLPSNDQFVSGSLDGSIALWSSKGKILTTYKSHHVSDVVVSHSGKYVYAVFGNSVITVFEISNESTPKFVPNKALNIDVGKLLNSSSLITVLSLSYDDKYMFIQTAGDKRNVNVLDMEKGTIDQYDGVRQGRFILKGCFGGSGHRFLCCGSVDGSVLIWNVSTKQQLSVLRGHSNTVNCVAWNQSNIHMMASCSDDGVIIVWESEATNA